MENKLKPIELSLANKVLRIVWNFVWLFLYRPTPRAFHLWRKFLLVCFGAKVGKGAHCYPSAKIWAPWNLEIGDGSCISEYVDCYNVDKVVIGKKSTVSQYSFLCTASHDYESMAMPLITAPIVIGDYVWVTSDVFVAPGVTINNGAVVTARSSVFKDLPEWMLCKGNPATPFKPRKVRPND